MNQIRELTISEIDNVSGGIIPAIIAIDIAILAFGVGFYVGYNTVQQH